MLHTIDIASNFKINKEPSIVKYWITGELSPSIKTSHIKIITNDNIAKNKDKTK